MMISDALRNQRDELAWESVKALGPEAMEKFVRMVTEGGQTPVMAAMLVSRQPPGLGFGDHILVKNRSSLLEQFGGSHIVLDHWQREYRRRTGEDIPSDAVIMRSLASGTGDPDAVITHKHSLQDVLAAARRRNLKLEGDVQMDPDPSIPPVVQSVRMGDDLIDKYAQQYYAEDPRLRERDPREVREMVVSEHTEKRDVSSLNPYNQTTIAGLAKKLFVS